MDFTSSVILLIGGIIGGLYAGNIGGAALIGFPLLIFLGFPTVGAIATHRLAVVILELASIIKFWRAKKIHLRISVILGIIAAVGSVIGANIVINIEENLLNIIIGILLTIVAIFILVKDKIGLKEKKVKYTFAKLVAIISVLFLLGIYGGFFGAGFGTFNLVLVAFLGYSFINSASIGRIIGLFMSTTAAIIFAKNNLISYPEAILLGVGFAVGSWIGINIALNKGNRYIKKLLLLVIILTVIKLIGDFAV